MADKKQEIVYIDSLIDPFFESACGSAGYEVRGQICWTAFPFFENSIAAWRPEFIEDEDTDFAQSDYFRLEENPSDLFDHGKPLLKPRHRESNQEFLFACGKRRPIIILGIQKNLQIEEARKGHKINHDLAFAIPVYSVSNSKNGKPKFKQSVIDGIRLLRYGNLFFIPEFPSVQLKPSVAQLDLLGPISLQLLQPLPVKLTDDGIQLISEMYYALITGRIEPKGRLALYHELLRTQ